MRFTLKFSFAAALVSVALTGCKSTDGIRVVEKPKTEQAVTISNKSAKSDNAAQPTAPQTAVLPNNSIPPLPSSQATLTAVAPVNEDRAGKNWRVIPLSTNASTHSASEARRVEREHFLLPESATASSPFVADEEEKEQNAYLVLDLGTREKPHPFVIALQKDGANYLGQHTGQVKPTGWEGEKIVQVDEDGNVLTEKADALHYLYVNQPFSSYGAFYTNENDSNLFHLRLSTGRNSQRQQDGSTTHFAEYGAFSYANGVTKWNEGLVGELTYHGNVIARVEHTENGKTTATTPQFDGEVKLTLNLNDAWDKNTLSGEIRSQTLGTIQLNEATLPDPRYLRDSITFNGEPTVKNNEVLSGFYSTQFVGDMLHDAVGTIELESDFDEGITKYNAVFGGMKQ